ncbi:MAG TPA: CoA transferase [Stellaceae bacterium]|nr:CoA transferase [Stellaceae bacterium]
MAELALEGLRVIDLTSHLSGPYCSMLLADHGADVIKVERPEEGDDTRRMPPFVNGESSPFMLWNRNKRSIALDLKLERDRDICRDLARDADIFLENFKPGTAARLGLGYAELAALNPRLVYCSISGYGQTGPYRERPGFDLMMQAMSGIMSVTGPEDGPPYRLPLAICDIGAGMFAAFGILAALQARTRSGHGQQVDTSLYEAGIAFGLYEAAHLFATGERPARLGQAHRGGAPYQVFRTADGWVTIGPNTQPLWRKFCAAIGREELARDPRFEDIPSRVANRKALVALLEEVLARHGTAHWVDLLTEAGVPVAPVLTYDEVFEDPQAKARAMVAEIEHPLAGRMRTLGIPVKLSATPGKLRRPAPRLDEHGAEIRAELCRRDAGA